MQAQKTSRRDTAITILIQGGKMNKRKEKTAIERLRAFVPEDGDNKRAAD
jgi:hypothetical protein